MRHAPRGDSIVRLLSDGRHALRLALAGSRVRRAVLDLPPPSPLPPRPPRHPLLCIIVKSSQRRNWGEMCECDWCERDGRVSVCEDCTQADHRRVCVSSLGNGPTSRL
eukprot:5162235-Prymnesium_polylepis.1